MHMLNAKTTVMATSPQQLVENFLNLNTQALGFYGINISNTHKTTNTMRDQIRSPKHIVHNTAKAIIG